MATQNEFLKSLESELRALPETERKEIIRDQEEYIRDAINSGRSELDVLVSLGDPKALARTLVAESRMAAIESSKDAPQQLTEHAGSIMRAVFALVALAPFNLIFVLGPALAVLGVLIGGWAAGLAGLFASMGIAMALVVQLLPLHASMWANISAGLFCAGLTLFSVAFLIGMGFVTAGVGQMAVRYLQWNLSFVTQSRSGALKGA